MAYEQKLLMIDPPWPQSQGGHRTSRPRQAGKFTYQTLALPDIFDLLDTEFGLAHEAPVVFMWAIDKFLHETERQMTQRGYKLHARIIWDKGNGIAPAFTIRFSHEYLLWFYKSPMPPVATEIRGKLRDVIHEPAREHSRKPDVAYEFVASLYPDAEKWDIFSREDRKGWQCWGDEVRHFATGEALLHS